MQHIVDEIFTPIIFANTRRAALSPFHSPTAGPTLLGEKKRRHAPTVTASETYISASAFLLPYAHTGIWPTRCHFSSGQQRATSKSSSAISFQSFSACLVKYLFYRRRYFDFGHTFATHIPRSLVYYFGEVCHWQVRKMASIISPVSVSNSHFLNVYRFSTIALPLLLLAWLFLIYFAFIWC
jgi:hypothetical protein